MAIHSNGGCRHLAAANHDREQWCLLYRYHGFPNQAEKRSLQQDSERAGLQNSPPPKVPACVRKYNVFEANETYYVFFIYARKTTAQTYQIYVGQDFEVPRGEARPGEALPRGAAGGFSASRMTIANENFVFTPDLPGQPTTPGIKPDYSRVATEGILTVKINFADVTGVDPTPDKLCQPRTFCAPSTDKAQCVSAVSDTDPLLKANPKLKEDISAACFQKLAALGFPSRCRRDSSRRTSARGLIRSRSRSRSRPWR